MPKRTKKTDADWANVMRVYERVMREFGPAAPAVKKGYFYQMVAEETKYAEETVKQIIRTSLRSRKHKLNP